MINTSTKAKLEDCRNGKVYIGPVVTELKAGLPFKINISNTHDFVIGKVQRCLNVGDTYWIIDAHNLKFKLTFL